MTFRISIHFNEIIAFLPRKCTIPAASHEGLFGEGEVILTAGGSDFFDLVLEQLKAPSNKLDVVRVIRSGCYLTHDSLNYKRIFEKIKKRSLEVNQLAPGLEPALQVWGAVQSLPESGLAILMLHWKLLLFPTSVPFSLEPSGGRGVTYSNTVETDVCP